MTIQVIKNSSKFPDTYEVYLDGTLVGAEVLEAEEISSRLTMVEVNIKEPIKPICK